MIRASSSALLSTAWRSRRMVWASSISRGTAARHAVDDIQQLVAIHDPAAAEAGAAPAEDGLFQTIDQFQEVDDGSSAR